MMANSNSEHLDRTSRLRLAAVIAAALLGAAFFPIAAHAQLGATAEEVSKIYGQPIRKNARIWHSVLYDTTVLDGDIYHKDDVFMRAAFHQGRVVLLELNVAGRLLTQKDIDGFLASNQEGAVWEMGKDSTDAAKFYHRSDGGAIAHWAVGANGSLLISVEKSAGDKIDHLGDKLMQ